MDNNIRHPSPQGTLSALWTLALPFLFCCAITHAAPVPNQPYLGNDGYDLANLNWGMSRQQVEEALGFAPLLESGDTQLYHMYYTDVLHGVKVSVRYTFFQEKLLMAEFQASTDDGHEAYEILNSFCTIARNLDAYVGDGQDRDCEGGMHERLQWATPRTIYTLEPIKPSFHVDGEGQSFSLRSRAIDPKGVGVPDLQ